jgi:putative ABC transport system permease protein
VISCASGATVAIGVIVGLLTLTRSVRTLVAVSGIVLGEMMTAATLTGRRLCRRHAPAA